MTAAAPPAVAPGTRAPAGGDPAAGALAAGAGAAVDRGPRQRIVALDAVRGVAIVILLITSHPGPRDAMPSPLVHAEWHGLTFADTFFPLFLFAVGAAMPFSRKAAGPATALRRAALLVVAGIALESLKSLSFDWRSGGVLQHIAIAYVVAWLVLCLPRRWWVPAAAGLLAAVWIAHLVAAGPGDDPWSKTSSFTHLVDGWVHGGFRTEGALQSVVSAVNIVAGAIAGRLVLDRTGAPAVLRATAGWAAAFVGAGVALAPLVPVNKHLWTPSFAVLTAGLCLAWFAAALLVVDIAGFRRAAHPLTILGSNPLAIYVVFQLAASLLARVQSAWLPPLDATLSPTALTLSLSAVWTALGFAFCLVLWRRRLFLTV